MKALDFFCGAGGLTRGLLDAGIEVIAGVDADGGCQQTYELNNIGARFVEADVTKLGLKELKEMIGSTAANELLIAGCAPCQPFSKQRKPEQANEKNAKKRKADARLLGELARIIALLNPACVLVENVPGLTKIGGYSTYRRFVKMLKDRKYIVDERVLDAKHFGVPQSRRRYVLMASRIGIASLPEPTHGNGKLAFTTVRQAIEHYPPLKAGESSAIIANHAAAILSDLNKERLRATPSNGGDRRSWDKSLVLTCHKGKYEGHSDVYGRMFWDRPAPTLTSKCNSLSNGRYGHPKQNRAISLREAASLQTFPDSYIFYGGSLQVARQIGNAVPVVLAKALGTALLCSNSSR